MVTKRPKNLCKNLTVTPIGRISPPLVFSLWGPDGNKFSSDSADVHFWTYSALFNFRKYHFCRSKRDQNFFLWIFTPWYKKHRFGRNSYINVSIPDSPYWPTSLYHCVHHLLLGKFYLDLCHIINNPNFDSWKLIMN